jgi:hypothetical protein
MQEQPRQHTKKKRRTEKIVLGILVVMMMLCFINAIFNGNITERTYEKNVPTNELSVEANIALNETLKSKCREAVEETNGPVTEDYIRYSGTDGTRYYCKVGNNFYRYTIVCDELLHNTLQYVIYDQVDAVKATGLVVDELEFSVEGRVFKSIQYK